MRLRVRAIVLSTAMLAACGASLPARRVVEHDLGDYRYRRYQRVLDVEIPVEGNPAVGHTASYVHAEGHEALRLATAFVTEYRSAAGLAAEVKEAMEALGTYDAGHREQDGAWVWTLASGGEGDSVERWVVWVSGRYIVKLGGPRGRDVPDTLVETYLALYPSDLDQHGRARPGTASAGPSQRERHTDGSGDTLPSNLREGAPR